MIHLDNRILLLSDTLSALRSLSPVMLAVNIPRTEIQTERFRHCRIIRELQNPPPDTYSLHTGSFFCILNGNSHLKSASERSHAKRVASHRGENHYPVLCLAKVTNSAEPEPPDVAHQELSIRQT